MIDQSRPRWRGVPMAAFSDRVASRNPGRAHRSRDKGGQLPHTPRPGRQQLFRPNKDPIHLHIPQLSRGTEPGRRSHYQTHQAPSRMLHDCQENLRRGLGEQCQSQTVSLLLTPSPNPAHKLIQARAARACPELRHTRQQT